MTKYSIELVHIFSRNFIKNDISLDTDWYLAMRNPELTKEKIINVASKLFNIQGYKATSISDITNAAGLTKGAIYAHFTNKSELEKACLLHMTKGMVTGLTKGIKSQKNTSEKMQAIFDYFKAYSFDGHEFGGCPILNASVEADDTNKELKDVVTMIIETIIIGIKKVLSNGIKHGEIKESAQIDQYANLMFSSIEGAIVLTRVTNNRKHMDIVVDHLKNQFEQMLVE